MKRLFLILLMLTGATLVSFPVGAHPRVGQRIHDVDHRIATEPSNPDHYLHRGRLQTEQGNFAAAHRDFLRAKRAGAPPAEVEFHRGETWLEAGAPERAVLAFDRALAVHPAHIPARTSRAKALERLHRPADAADELAWVIRHAKNPSSDPYDARIRLLMEMGPEFLDEAADTADDGIRRLDRPVALVALSVELEASRGQPRAALAQIDALPNPLASAPHWLYRRGNLLYEVGSPLQAYAVHLFALFRLSQFPESRRSAPALAELRSQLRLALTKA